MITPPLRPTFSRWLKLYSTQLTIQRSLQYEAIPQIKGKGRILDIGGGKTAHYNNLLHFDSPVDSLNVSPKYEPTYVADANQPWPIEDATYDTIISFNTFEHLENDVFALSEALRVLKPGGTIYILVPFLYRVHASPFDYHRHTHHAWEKMLVKCGVPPENQRIEPQIWDSLATGFSFLEPTRLRYFKPLIMLVGVLRCLGLKGDRLPEEMAKSWQEWALCYFITATKPGG